MTKPHPDHLTLEQFRATRLWLDPFNDAMFEPNLAACPERRGYTYAGCWYIGWNKRSWYFPWGDTHKSGSLPECETWLYDFILRDSGRVILMGDEHKMLRLAALSAEHVAQRGGPPL